MPSVETNWNGCQNCSLRGHRKLSRWKKFIKKIINIFFCLFGHFGSNFVDFWHCLLGKHFKTVLPVFIGTLLEESFFSKEVSFFQDFWTWCGNYFGSLAIFFQNFCQNCNRRVKKNNLRRCIFFLKNSVFVSWFSDMERKKFRPSGYVFPGVCQNWVLTVHRYNYKKI